MSKLIYALKTIVILAKVIGLSLLLVFCEMFVKIALSYFQGKTIR